MIYMLTASEIVTVREFILDLVEYTDLDEYQENTLQDVLEILSNLTPTQTEVYLNYIEDITMTEETKVEETTTEAPMFTEEQLAEMAKMAELNKPEEVKKAEAELKLAEEAKVEVKEEELV